MCSTRPTSVCVSAAAVGRRCARRRSRPHQCPSRRLEPCLLATQSCGCPMAASRCVRSLRQSCSRCSHLLSPSFSQRWTRRAENRGGSNEESHRRNCCAAISATGCAEEPPPLACASPRTVGSRTANLPATKTRTRVNVWSRTIVSRLEKYLGLLQFLLLDSSGGGPVGRHPSTTDPSTLELLAPLRRSLREKSFGHDGYLMVKVS